MDATTTAIQREGGVMSDEELMLISAVRYALGRQSYIVGVTCNFVKSIKSKLSQHCIAILIRDIEEELEMCQRLGRTCGMECDERSWMILLRVLKEEV